jgi:hypothetical protein
MLLPGGPLLNTPGTTIYNVAFVQGGVTGTAVPCTLIVNSNPTLTLTVTDACSGLLQVAVAGGVPSNYTYVWKKSLFGTANTTITLPNQTPATEQSYTYLPVASGGFNVQYTVEVTDIATGCKNSVTRAQPPCCSKQQLTTTDVMITNWNASAFAPFPAARVLVPSSTILAAFATANTLNPSFAPNTIETGNNARIFFDDNFVVDNDFTFLNCPQLLFDNTHEGTYESKITVNPNR